ncbi:MAG: hypothetical protein J6C46_08640 [Clostridia bacterium]|nr:hypothetical protein [Clostridia bacterium]
MKKIKLNIQLFASGTFNVSTGNANISGYVQMTSTSNGSSANSSNVTATLYLRRTNNYTGSPSSTSSFSVTFTINGTEKKVTASSRVTIPNDKSYVNLGSASVTVPHNNDGTKTCSISVKTTSTNSSFSVPLTTGSLTLDTIPRYANITTFYLTTLSRTQIQVNWDADVSCDAVEYSLNSGGWTRASGYPSFVIGGLSAGTQYSVRIRVLRSDSQLWTESSSTPLYATTKSNNSITGANDFNDEQNPYLTFSRPSGLGVNLALEFAGQIIKRDGISGSSYTFNLTDAERKLLRQSATSNTLTVRYVVCTVENGSEVSWSWLDKTMTIVNANPVFTDFIFEDINPNSVALTGNNQIFINKISKVKVTVPVANKMVALKEASPKRYEMTLGSTNSVAYSDTNDVYAEFNNVETNNISVTAYDSRNNKKPVSKTATLLQYSEPTFSNIKIGRQNGVGTVVDLSVSGNYSTTNFGNATNTILNVAYTKDNGENWIDITDKFIFTDGTFSSIAGAVLPDFELGTEYEVIFMVTDGGIVDGTNYSLRSVSSTKQTINSGQPILDINKTKKGVGINCIAEAEGLWVNGEEISNCKILSEGTNIDELKRSGNFAIYNARGTLPSGYSTTDNNIFIKCYQWFKNYGRQLLFDVRTNKTFSRNLNNGVWKDWINISYNPNPVGEFTLWEGNFFTENNIGWKHLGTVYSLVPDCLYKFPLRQGYTRKYKLAVDYTTTNTAGFHIRLTKTTDGGGVELIYGNVWGSTDDGVRAHGILDLDLNAISGSHVNIECTTAFATQSWYRVYKIAVLVYDVLE